MCCDNAPCCESLLVRVRHASCNVASSHIALRSVPGCRKYASSLLVCLSAFGIHAVADKCNSSLSANSPYRRPDVRNRDHHLACPKVPPTACKRRDGEWCPRSTQIVRTVRCVATPPRHPFKKQNGRSLFSSANARGATVVLRATVLPQVDANTVRLGELILHRRPGRLDVLTLLCLNMTHLHASQPWHRTRCLRARL